MFGGSNNENTNRESQRNKKSMFDTALFGRDSSHGSMVNLLNKHNKTGAQDLRKSGISTNTNTKETQQAIKI
jgi:hypothetical protein